MALTLNEYRNKNQKPKLWYAAKTKVNSVDPCNAYAFSTKEERDWFVHRNNMERTCSSWNITRQDALSIAGFTNPKTDVVLIDDLNKIVVVSE